MSKTATLFQDLIKDEYEKNKRDLLLKTGFVGQTYQAFLVKTLEDILNVEIVPRIRLKITQAGYSQKIADAVHIAASPISKGPGLISWNVVSDYKAKNGFPVAVMIEKGRIAYTIFPKGKEKKLNSSINLPGPGGGSNWLVFTIKLSGKTVFAKKAKIPRFMPTNFVRDTIKERKGIVQEKLDLATQRFVDDIMTDTPLP